MDVRYGHGETSHDGPNGGNETSGGVQNGVLSANSAIVNSVHFSHKRRILNRRCYSRLRKNGRLGRNQKLIFDGFEQIKEKKK